ncbi:hypothetical protein GC197_11630 [bacterium]|nr:hypothetical protein [bacterium]
MLDQVPTYFLFVHHDGPVIVAIYGTLIAFVLPLAKYCHDKLGPFGKLLAVAIVALVFLPLVVFIINGIFYSASCLYGYVQKRFQAFLLPRCSQCGNKLKSDKAKQCLSCGYDWHHEAVSEKGAEDHA